MGSIIVKKEYLKRRQHKYQIGSVVTFKNGWYSKLNYYGIVVRRGHTHSSWYNREPYICVDVYDTVGKLVHKERICHKGWETRLMNKEDAIMAKL